MTYAMNSQTKVAIITGAGSGIGKQVTLALLREKYSVALAGRRQDSLEAVANEGKGLGGQTFILPTDVSDPASVQHLFARVKERFGRLDLLFNNAGISAPG